jgi:hypothetical protein
MCEIACNHVLTQSLFSICVFQVSSRCELMGGTPTFHQDPLSTAADAPFHQHTRLVAYASVSKFGPAGALSSPHEPFAHATNRPFRLPLSRHHRAPIGPSTSCRTLLRPFHKPFPFSPTLDLEPPLDLLPSEPFSSLSPPPTHTHTHSHSAHPTTTTAFLQPNSRPKPWNNPTSRTSNDSSPGLSDFPSLDI